jgi:hypothetical protein
MQTVPADPSDAPDAKPKEAPAKKSFPDFEYGPPSFVQNKKQNLLALAGIGEITKDKTKGLNLKHLTS